ncbi:MAG: NAD(P)H-binding protein [Candidatus Sumerlaeota bacterium]|nr:NAD(P)H-binding protein [Candidatus Sumerlaeota bacterium]
MTDQGLHAVTGAFGYSGKYIAQRLLANGRRVISLTNSLNRPNPFGDRVKAFPLSFDDPDRLRESLRGVAVLYNTYWVRFNYRWFSHEDGVRNTKRLFQAAKEAGVERIVHVSITNPSEDSPLEYFRGKAQLERALRQTGLSHAILRPTVLFGKEDILINNMVWFLRRFPVFGVFGDGQYRLQPVYVDDLAQLAVEQGEKSENAVINAVGPETFTYCGLAEELQSRIGVRRTVVHIPPRLGWAVGWATGKLVRDVIITWPEIQGLMAGLLCVDTPPTGKTRLTDWVRCHAATLGRRYASELARRANREADYGSL